jgi:thioredoxin 1
MSHLKVMDFYADWCGPCKMFAPIFESVSSQIDGVEFEKINVDIDSEKSAKYAIRAIPTLILEKEGQIVYRKSGVLTEAELKTLIEENQ